MTRLCLHPLCSRYTPGQDAEYCCAACERAHACGLPPNHRPECNDHHYGNVSIGESGVQMAERRRGE